MAETRWQGFTHATEKTSPKEPEVDGEHTKRCGGQRGSLRGHLVMVSSEAPRVLGERRTPMSVHMARECASEFWKPRRRLPREGERPFFKTQHSYSALRVCGTWEVGQTCGWAPHKDSTWDGAIRGSPASK